MSNINRISNNPNVDISKLAGGPCKITLRNTTHVSDKAAYRNYQANIGNLRHNTNIGGNRKKI